MKIKPGLLLIAVLAVGFSFTNSSGAEECDAPVPICVDVPVLTEQKVQLRSRCRYKVTIHVVVENGLGTRFVHMNASDGNWDGYWNILDEDDKYATIPGVEPTYRTELKCCTHFDGYACSGS